MRRWLTDRASLYIQRGFILAIVAVGSPSDIYGQPPSSHGVPQPHPPEVPVQPVEEINTFTRLRWTLQLLFASGAVAHVNPLYAYDPASVEARLVYPDRIGPVAMVGACIEVEGEWCAQYFSDVTAAYRAAYVAADDGDYYFATTYPLANIRPARRFISQQSP